MNYATKNKIMLHVRISIADFAFIKFIYPCN